MSIKVSCSACGIKLKVGDELGGKRGKCPKCKSIIEIPEPIPPATEKQKNFARELGISFPDDINRRKISTLIDKALEKENERRNELQDRESKAYAALRQEALAEVDEDNPRVSDASPDSIARALGERGLGAILITFDIETLYNETINFNVVHDEDNMDDEDVHKILSHLGLHYARLGQ
tara:strand:+ start:241 stop:774 length:534 start_codon:yes stop_codon:yes gene_type:complete